MRWLFVQLLCIVIGMPLVGCQSTPKSVRTSRVIPKVQPAQNPVQQVAFEDTDAAEAETLNGADSPPTPDANNAREQLPPALAVETLTLAELTESVRIHFPMIQQAIAARMIASGEVLAANGSFDHKLEGYSNSQPLDFYENYRHSLGLKRDTYWGGEVFAGYRVGRGIFEPWYLERETNKGGEFKAGVVVPLARDTQIDANRAELWRAQLERGRVEPEIRALIISSIRDASVAYWSWIASAESYLVAEEILQLGLNRRGFLERQVELGEKAEIDLVDNQRIILTRSAKVTDARRKLEQAAVKLSLFLRDDFGRPIVLPVETVKARFPQTLSVEVWGEAADVALAQANRPELEELQIVRRQLAVLLRQACNETRPQLDAGMLVAQDVGEPTSSKRDKSEFEVEATMTLSVPLERRKALGKARQLRGKIAQIRAKTQFASDKITAEIQSAHVALTAAATRVDQTTAGLALAKRMQEAEQRLYELGQSSLFNLNLREQQAVEAAIDRIAALFDYHVALADYAASLGFESADDIMLQPTEGESPQ